MNSFIKQIHRHRSVRKYLDRAIPTKLLDQLLAAGSMASSSGNMQAYSIIVTSEPVLKRQLYSAHFEQSMVLEAPVFLTFCADFHRMRQWLKISEAELNFDNFISFMIAAIDAILVSQTVALAAESEGLGICYLGTTLANCDEISRILNCPDHVVPVVGFSLGYPDEHPQAKTRLPMPGLVHLETYRSYQPEQIQEIYREREKVGWNRYMADPLLRKTVEDAGLQNLAQVYTQAKYTRDSHLKYSQTLLKRLRESGFLEN